MKLEVLNKSKKTTLINLHLSTIIANMAKKSFRGAIEETLTNYALEVMEKMNEAIDGKVKYSAQQFEADKWFIRSLGWVLKEGDEEIVNQEGQKQGNTVERI